MPKKISIIIALILLVLLAPARAETFSFAQYGDVHLADTGATTTILLDRLAAFVNTGLGAPVDFVIDTGDIHQDGDRTAVYQEYIKALACLNVPAYILRGNHDTGPDFHEVEWRSATGRDVCFSFVHQSVAFIGFDTGVSEPSWQNVSASSATLAWLAAERDRLPPSMPIVLFTHVPLASRMGLPKGYPLVNRKEVLDLFHGRKVLAVIGGHYHGAKESIENGVLFTTTPTFSPNRTNHDKTKDGAVRLFTIQDGTIRTKLKKFPKN